MSRGEQLWAPSARQLPNMHASSVAPSAPNRAPPRQGVRRGEPMEETRGVERSVGDIIRTQPETLKTDGGIDRIAVQLKHVPTFEEHIG